MFDHFPSPASAASGEEVTARQRGAQLPTWGLVLLVWAGFALYGAWRTPVPGVNEPHYLCKARHFWDSDWCRRDLFLDSSNPHWVFYATVGGLTNFLTFEQAAWAGRGCVWCALAAGGVALARRVVPGARGVLWGVAFFLGLSATGNLSGEWLIGGVEAKGFSYAALFLAMAGAGDGRWISAAAWCGMAVSFHPVVGVWGAIAIAFARVWTWGTEDRKASRGIHPPCPPSAHVPLSDLGTNSHHVTRIAPLLIFAVFSLPGLIPAASLVLGGAPPEVTRAADEFQVFQRLDHHLDPTKFKASGWWMYGMLLAIWLAFRPWRTANPAQRFFFRFVVGALLIATFGMGVGFGPRWANVMKFYPFRLVDLFLPLAVALVAAQWLEGMLNGDAARHPQTKTDLSRRSAAPLLTTHHSPLTPSSPTPALPPQGGEGEGKGGAFSSSLKPQASSLTSQASSVEPSSTGALTSIDTRCASAALFRGRSFLGHALALAAFAWSLAAPGNDRNPTGWTARQQADWLDVCQWVVRETPADALFLTPRFRNYTFKWHTARAEYAIWKDCPQDAPSLVEWRRRLDVVRHWRGTHYETGFTEDALKELQASTGVDYIVDWYFQPYRTEPVYRNGSFRVYRVGVPSN